MVDTNVWVAGVLSARRLGSPTRAVVDAYLAGRFHAVISLPLLNELDEVFARPRIRARATAASVRAMAALLRLLLRESRVKLAGTTYGCRDPADDAVIETAICGEAHYLVTGDQDLEERNVAIALGRRGVSVIRPTTFAERIVPPPAPPTE